MNRIYIGLCGRAQHGKSTLARQLASFYGEQAAVTAFANVPKQMLNTFGLSEAQLYGHMKGVQDSMLGMHTARYAMQTLATEWGRKMMYDEIWVDAWQRQVNKLPHPVIIIEDVRHGPEIERLMELDAYLVEVVRPALLPQTRLAKLRHAWRQRWAHSSERLDFGKYRIPRLHNLSTPEALLDEFFNLFPSTYHRRRRAAE